MRSLKFPSLWLAAGLSWVFFILGLPSSHAHGPRLEWVGPDGPVAIAGMEEGRLFVIEEGVRRFVPEGALFSFADLPPDLLERAVHPPRARLGLMAAGRPRDVLGSPNFTIAHDRYPPLSYLFADEIAKERADRRLMIHGWFHDGRLPRFEVDLLERAKAHGVSPQGVRFEPAFTAPGLRPWGGFLVYLLYDVDTGLVDAGGQFGPEAPLVRAVLRDDRDGVRRLLDEGADPNRMGAGGWAPVHFAATVFNEAARLVLAHPRANPALADTRKWTPLHYAAAAGNTAAGALLVARGVSVREPNDMGETPAALAAAGAPPAFLELLATQRQGLRERTGRDAAVVPMHVALNHRRDDLIPIFRANRVRLQLDRDNTAFFLSGMIAQDRLEIVRLLIEEERIDIRERNWRHDPPFLLAAQFGSPELMDYLVSLGLSPEVTNSAGFTPLHLAATGNPAGVAWFLDNGADPNARSNTGSTPLLLALLAHNLETAALLLNGGADPNAELGGVEHILWMATRLAQRDAVRLLIDAGAVCDFTPATALELMEDAFRFDIPEIFEITLAQCLEVDFAFPGGFPAWGVAELYGAERILDLMIERGLPASARRPLDLVAAGALPSRLQPLHIKAPPYPDALALRYGDQTIRVDLVVDREGRVRFPRIAENPIPELSDAVLDAARHWRFHAPELPEGAVGVRARLPLRLETDLRILDLSQLRTPPRVLYSRRPRHPTSLFTFRGWVEMEYIIDREGAVVPDHMRVLATTHQRLAESVLEALPHWRFEPATVDGELTFVRVRQRFHFGN